jgi:hypothetical protein
MSNRIDCSLMSHAACIAHDEPVALDQEPEPVSLPGPAREGTASDLHASYDCVNDCLSSLGIPTVIASATVGVGCAIVTAGACAALAGGALGALIGACAAGCDEVESRP